MASNSIDTIVEKIGKNARKASLALQNVSIKNINKALLLMAKSLELNKKALQKANKLDLDAGVTKKMSPAMLDRLTLSDKTLSSMIQGLREVAALTSPVGQELEQRTRPNGLVIFKRRVPIGVIGIIYESRPNVTIDAAAICLKSANAVILRGGSEAINSNVALIKLFADALTVAGLPEKAIQIIPTTDRTAIDRMLTLEEQIDLIIPRGGEGLIRMVVEKSHIPVIKHYKGICHIYLSQHCAIEKALPIVLNAKIQRPGVCNAMETLLIDKKLKLDHRRQVINALLENKVVLMGDPETRKLSPLIKRATIEDWKAEYLDLRLAVRTVDGISEAIDHINTYGSHHTDAIVTESDKESLQFQREVDSASVMVNTSTRFSDGGEYGMGCEIGISTDKLHARGPMGIDDLTTYKWIVLGNGQIRI